MDTQQHARLIRLGQYIGCGCALLAIRLHVMFVFANPYSNQGMTYTAITIQWVMIALSQRMSYVVGHTSRSNR